MSEIPDPLPRAGEVRVRIRYSGVNPTDWKRRTGEAPLHHGFQVPHQDGSGNIDLVGDGVKPERIGQRVWVYHAAVGHEFGTAAEYVCLPERQAVVLPTGISLAQGATLGIPYLTAAHALSFAKDLDNANVLVQGGAGAVGYAAIQLARQSNHTIVTTVSTDYKADLADQARPDAVLNYRSPTFASQLAGFAGTGFDLITEVDLRMNLATYIPHLACDAHIVAYASDGSDAPVPVRSMMFRNANAHFFVVYLLAQKQVDAAVESVQEMLTFGDFTSLPLHEYELDAVSDAHDDVQEGLVGRAIIRIQ